MKEKGYTIRCKSCGLIRVAFHGWAFSCYKCPNKLGNNYHDWEVVDNNDSISIGELRCIDHI